MEKDYPNLLVHLNPSGLNQRSIHHTLKQTRLSGNLYSDTAEDEHSELHKKNKSFS